MKVIHKVAYKLHRYFVSSKPVFPIIFIISSIGILYSVKPMDVTSGFIISGVLQFCLMVFVTLNIGGSEIIVEEQILFLREKRVIDYFITRELSMVVICAIYSLLIDLGPVYVNIANHFGFFLRELTFYDVVIGYILILGSGLAGIAIGDVLNSRIMGNRKLSLVMTALIVVMTIANEGIQQQVKHLEILNYLLPPVMIPAKVFTGVDVIDGGRLIVIFLQTIIYYVVLTAIKFTIMNKNRFE